MQYSSGANTLRGICPLTHKKLLQNPVRRISHPAVCCPLVSASLSRTDINRQQHQGYQKSLQLILQQPQLIFILKEDKAA